LFPLERYPVYRRRGTLFPLDVDHPATLLGFLPLRHSEALTVLVHLCSSVAGDTFTMAEWRAPGVVLSYALDSAQLAASNSRQPPIAAHWCGNCAAWCNCRPLSLSKVCLALCRRTRRATRWRATAATVVGWCRGDATHGEVLGACQLPVMRCVEPFFS
jgi:hypothetical protein